MVPAQRLGGMSQNAPKAETELLSSFAANPDKSPGTVRDVIIRGQALLQQQHDYYKGYDPFRSNQAVPDYTDNFYENHPFESYRSKLEKTVQNPPATTNQASNPPSGKVLGSISAFWGDTSDFGLISGSSSKPSSFSLIQSVSAIAWAEWVDSRSMILNEGKV